VCIRRTATGCTECRGHDGKSALNIAKVNGNEKMIVLLSGKLPRGQ
jgi:hypothetical protein